MIAKAFAKMNDFTGAGNASLNTFKGINFDGSWSFFIGMFSCGDWWVIDFIFRGDFLSKIDCWTFRVFRLLVFYVGNLIWFQSLQLFFWDNIIGFLRKWSLRFQSGWKYISLCYFIRKLLFLRLIMVKRDKESQILKKRVVKY